MPKRTRVFLRGYRPDSDEVVVEVTTRLDPRHLGEDAVPLSWLQSWTLAKVCGVELPKEQSNLEWMLEPEEA